MATLFLGLLFLKGYRPSEPVVEIFYHIQVNGQDVGTLTEGEGIQTLFLQARKDVAGLRDELTFMDASLSVRQEEVVRGEADREGDAPADVLARMEEVLKAGVHESMHRAYTVKIREAIHHLASQEDVCLLLQAALDKYGNDGSFRVRLKREARRGFSVLTAQVEDGRQQDTADWHSGLESGVEQFFSDTEEQPQEEQNFEDYQPGIQAMGFSQEVEVVEAYLPESSLTPVEEAIELVVMEQETPGIYQVEAGDTLSEISIKVNIPMDTIVAMNDSLEDINSMLHVGQELLITVPEPELSVTRVERACYEETYDADVIYIDNDDWYTTDTVVRRPPSAGFRKVVADVSYVNEKEVGRELVQEDVVMEAVAKVVERGTKIPPTYIKPIYGGRITSTFGWRPVPTRGATSNHQGVDWATPMGTPVYASCGGTVSKAGWGGGYGYVIFIEHEDGRQTRYGHLSKVQVSVGQQVEQGEQIALSGSTGVSTGPHVHFEIRIGGTPVNPLDYLD